MGAKDGRAYVPPPLPPRQRELAADASWFESMLEDGSDRPSGWLYQQGGQVFGPVSAKALLELLYDGTIDFETQVAPESGEFKPARRYGVFRSHREKVAVHRAQIAEATRRIRDANRRTLRRRLGWSLLALGVVLGGGWGVRQVILEQRRAWAQAEARARAEAIEREMRQLLASVTLEPPLKPLFEEPPRAPRTKVGRRRRRQAGAPARGARGALTEAEIRREVGKALPGFKRCIVAQIHRDPKTVGEQIVVSFSVDNEGRAGNVSLADRFLRRSDLRPCMARELARLRWRPYTGEVRNIEYPIRIGRS